MNTSKITKTLISWSILLPVFICSLLPLIIVLITGLKPRNELKLIPPNWFPTEYIWNNFIIVWQETPIGQTLLNSLYLSSLTTAITLLVGAPSAYALVRMNFKGKEWYRLFLLTTQMLSPIVLVLGLFKLIVNVGGINSLSFLAVIYAAFNVAFCVWMLQSYFKTIPKDLEESAWLEGAGHIRSLVTIFFPLAIPAIVIVAMFTFVNSWNEFIIALSTLRDSSKFTVQLGIVEMIGYYYVRWDFVMVASVLSTLPVVCIFAWLQKHIVHGLSAGAVK